MMEDTAEILAESTEEIEGTAEMPTAVRELV
jgi:hypothetical protein